MRLFKTNEIENLSKRYVVVNNGREYSVQLRDTAKSGADWWGLTLPNPMNWFRSKRLTKPQPMTVIFMQDTRLFFDHLIIVPVKLEGQEPASYKIPTRAKGGQ